MLVANASSSAHVPSCRPEEAPQPAPVLQQSPAFRHPAAVRMVQVHQPSPQSTPPSPSYPARTPRQRPDLTPTVLHRGVSSPHPQVSTPRVMHRRLSQSTSAVSDASWLPLSRKKETNGLQSEGRHGMTDTRIVAPQSIALQTPCGMYFLYATHSTVGNKGVYIYIYTRICIYTLYNPC